MAYVENWPRHLLANFTAKGFDNELAQDFWTEDLFDPQCMVAFHWLKLLWVYMASAVAQIALPLAVIAVPVTLVVQGSWSLSAIVIASVTVFASLGAAVFATAAWIDLKRHTAPK